LLKVGGELTTKHREQIARLDLSRSLTHVSGLTREILAEVYRRAPLVLIPSDAEGFGLPVVEALACGAPVVASDIPALREAGGTAALFAPVADIDAWSDLISKLFADPTIAPAASQRLEWSARFTWSAHAETIASAYHKLLRC
jgi:glycosyltransferase involved in cell wall biosynthesis